MFFPSKNHSWSGLLYILRFARAVVKPRMEQNEQNSRSPLLRPKGSLPSAWCNPGGTVE